MAFLMPVSRRLAMRLAAPASICRQHLHSSPTAQRRSLVLDALRATARPAAAAPRYARFQSTKPAVAEQAKAVAEESAKAYAEILESSSSKARMPEFTSDKAVGIWLLASAVSVFGLIVFGGLTRLTESGLSITEWRPVTGSKPPMGADAWNSEFDKYRASPEFQLLNPHMSLEEFKKIYFMEWFHRVWGRFVGASFVLPAIYFVARRRVSVPMSFNLLGISALIGFQGFIGWWMVKSGLKDDLFAPGSHPRVSQYRLATHLGAAVVCYSWMLVSALTVMRTRRLMANPAAAIKAVTALQSPTLTALRRSVTGIIALVSVTILSGALVAGLDAGLIYNEFPNMGVGLAPPASELWDPHYSRKPNGSDLVWRNMLENPATVQLDHRILATSTFFSIVALFIYSRRPQMKAAIPKDARRGVMGLLHLGMTQVALGISTLIYMVPLPLAALHQACALALLTGGLVLGQRLRVPKSVMATLYRRAKMAGPAAPAKNAK